MSAAALAPDTIEPVSDYWRQSARPLVSLVFVAPLLVAYETGVIWLGSAAARNGADVWLRELLDLAGFGQYCLLPLLTCGLLLAWHHTRREPWLIAAPVVRRMWLESAAWGAGLLIGAHVVVLLVRGGPLSGASVAAVEARHSAGEVMNSFVGYLGAGIYEELLFRLLLVPPMIALLRAARFNRKASLITTVVLTSLVFATAHYQIDAVVFGMHLVWRQGELFSPLSFAFRFAAGSAFAVLFAYRGFGITVGAHALYDLLVLLV